MPSILRDCLERCINEEPTPQNLERALPEIRTTIVNLLQGLKTKQAVYKARREDEKRRAPSGSSPAPTERPSEPRRSGETRRSGEDRRYSPSPSKQASPLPPTPDDGSRWQPPKRSSSGHASSSRPLPAQPPAGSSSRLPAVQTAPQPHAYPERTASSSSSVYSSYAPSVVHPHDTPPDRPPSSEVATSMSKRHFMSSRSRPQAARPGDPLPAPPPDAFRPPRRSGGGSGDSLERARSPNPGDERPQSSASSRGSQGGSVHAAQSPTATSSTTTGGPDIRRARSPTQESLGLGRGPAPQMTVSTSHQPMLLADNGPVSPRPVIRHSLSDPVSPPSTSTVFPTPSAAVAPPPQETVSTPLPPSVTAASPPASPGPLPAIPVSSPLLGVSPPMQTLPLPSPSAGQVEPLHPAPALPPVPNSIADQTLSNLRGSGNAISRRASQRYSLYQIEKISDSGPAKREKSSRRVSGMMGVMKDASLSSSSSFGDLSAMSKRNSPARPMRADRPPVTAGGSPLRGGGFVPPAEDAGVEVGVQEPDAASPDDALPSLPSRSIVRSRSGLLTPKGSLEPALSVLGEEDETASSSAADARGRSPSLATLGEHAAGAEPRSPDQVIVFLLHGRECKKVQIAPQPSVPVLRMLFMEKFGYATEGGEEWPAIYVQDPKTEWRYEWEETEDLADGVRLSLNIERESCGPALAPLAPHVVADSADSLPPLSQLSTRSRRTSTSRWPACRASSRT